MRKVDISRYMPPFLLEIEDFKFTVPKLNAEFERLYAAVDTLMLNQYILTMDENMLNKLEKQLKIIPSAQDTIENRRLRILSKYNISLPYTYRAVCDMIDNLCGAGKYSFSVDGYNVEVRIDLSVKKQLSIIKDMLTNILPANLVLNVDLKYNQYGDLRKFRHGELHKYKYGELRNEVLEHEQN